MEIDLIIVEFVDDKILLFSNLKQNISILIKKNAKSIDKFVFITIIFLILEFAIKTV